MRSAQSPTLKTLLAVALAWSSCPSMAHAENSAGGNSSRSDNSSQGSIDGNSSQNDSEMTTSVLLVVTAAGVALATYGTYRATTNTNQSGKVAEIYLRHHAIALRQDLCLGRGPLLHELLAALPMKPSQRASYAAAVRTRRRALLELADPAKLNPERALAFFEILRDLLPQPTSSKS